MDEREFFLLGLGILGLLASLSAVLVGIFGGILTVLSALLMYQGGCYLSRTSFRVGNCFKNLRPVRTQWCSKLQRGEAWVPPNVDEALERLLERILTEYVKSWYRDVTPDMEFMQELRLYSRDIANNILARLCKLDISELVVHDVIPVIVQHLDSYLWALHHTRSQENEDRKDLNTNYTEFLGKNVHVALSSREVEVEYLEDLTDRILPLVNKREKSGLVSSLGLGLVSRVLLLNLLDDVCDPRKLNKLLCLWFSPDPVKEFQSNNQPPVKLLFRFVHSYYTPNPSSLHLELSQILNDQELLCQFVHFLKKGGGVNLLNFCLAVEDFNRKIMVEGLSKHDLTALHDEASLLYSTYMREGSLQYISFQSEVTDDIYKILQSDYTDVEKLRTTPPLFRAYEQAYNNLADNYCPSFHLSSQFLNQAFGPKLCDSKPNSGAKQSSQDREFGGQLSKLKGVMGRTVEGSPDRGVPESAYDLVSSLREEDHLPQDLESRDLNAWRVEIPNVITRSTGGKSYFVFVIQVQRIDVASARDGQDLAWHVHRQYHEFYTLQSALVQYHGIFEDAKLPSRAKLFRGRGLDVLQSKVDPFQEYLVRLLQKPSLKKSDLLFTFLTSQSEFTEAASQLGLTRMIKSVPKRLTKEKGQFLQGFIQNFATSSLPPKNSNYLIHENEEEDNTETSLLTSIYKDNFSQLFPFTSASLGPSHYYTPGGMYDTVLFISIRLLRMSNTLVRLLYSVKWFIEGSITHLISYLLSTKLVKLLNNGRVAFIIDLIQESIFTEEEAGDEAFTKERTLILLRDYLPSALRTLSPEGFDRGTQELVQALQDPLLNKQLVYRLLETLLPKVFPELKSEK